MSNDNEWVTIADWAVADLSVGLECHAHDLRGRAADEGSSPRRTRLLAEAERSEAVMTTLENAADAALGILGEPRTVAEADAELDAAIKLDIQKRRVRLS